MLRMHHARQTIHRGDSCADAVAARFREKGAQLWPRRGRAGPFIEGRRARNPRGHEDRAVDNWGGGPETLRNSMGGESPPHVQTDLMARGSNHKIY